MSEAPARVGLFLTNQQPIGRDQVTALREQIQLVHAARDYGWDSLWTGQHFLPDSLTMLQPLPFLARLVPEAGEMLIGMGILLLALHNPLEVAESFASLDVVCAGRLIFGVGLGYRDVEYGAFAINRGERIRRFEANLEIVKALWSGEPVDAELPWCHLNGAKLSVVPVQRPRPPIWLAANNDGAVLRAARLGDTWFVNPHAPLSTIRRQIDLFQAERGRLGKAPPLQLPAMREVFCAATREKALELAGPYLDSKYRTYARWGQDKVLPGNESFDVGFERLEQERFIVGSPDDCIRRLLVWKALGVNHFIFRVHWAGMPVDSSLESIRLLSREVLPEFRLS